MLEDCSCREMRVGYNGAMLDRLITLLRKEAVLCIAFIFACASLSVAGDLADVPSYIDWRVIALLFCLMAAVAGMRESGVMLRAANALVAGERSQRFVALALVMLPFFASMLVTNDVALITFTPIAILSLEAAGWRDRIEGGDGSAGGGIGEACPRIGKQLCCVR